jgi:hypothetical protein
MHAPPDPNSEGAATRQSDSPHRQAKSSHPLDSLSPPDLQALVLADGTWDRIPAAAWREHDARLAAYRAAIRDGVRWHSFGSAR